MSSLVGLGKWLTPRNVLVAIIAHNMVARPSITLANKSLPEETRRYTATREFCTELFGLFNTLTVATAIERLGPRLVDRSATKEILNRVRNADWDRLTPKDQRLKALILICSLAGAAFSSGIVTPIMNNLVLNRLLDKIIGKSKPAASPTATPSGKSLSVQPGSYGLFDTFTRQGQSV